MANNHANYQQRLDFIHNLLKQLFSVEAADITPIQYTPSFPYKYNNFVYRITLPSPLPAAPDHEPKQQQQQPGTVPVPPSTTRLIVRLSNAAAEGMHAQTRVENEVAMMSLATAALSAFSPPVVPELYAWGSSSSAAEPVAQGWMLQQCMPGECLEEFDSLSLADKKEILAQQADLLKALQEYELPESIKLFGGVTFDAEGAVVSAPVPSMGGAGPWPSYQEMYGERLLRALREADANPYLKGWEANGIRKRLQAFVERGVGRQFEALESRDVKSIVHGDFTPCNLLYDSSTKRITALIDYDFACILHPSYEFLRSFGRAGGQFISWSDVHSAEQMALCDAKLHGFPTPLPKTTAGADGVNWDVAKAWEDELERVKVARPRTMKGIEKVADVDAVLRCVLPWRVTNADVLRMQSEETILKCRDESEGELVRLLGSLGF